MSPSLPRILGYLWASPWTLVALCIVTVARLMGCTVIRRQGTIGCFGPAMQKLLQCAPIAGGAAAITLGHVILATDRQAFDRSFEHEMVHVRQYERWGLFFIPAYLLASLWLMLRRKDYYRENPFEKPAFALDAQRWKEKHPIL